MKSAFLAYLASALVTLVVARVALGYVAAILAHDLAGLHGL